MKHYNANDAQTEIFDKFGAFFAFSTKQLDEHQQPGVTYVSAGMGLITPKGTTQKLLDELHTINGEIKNDTKRTKAVARTLQTITRRSGHSGRHGRLVHVVKVGTRRAPGTRVAAINSYNACRDGEGKIIWQYLY